MKKSSSFPSLSPDLREHIRVSIAAFLILIVLGSALTTLVPAATENLTRLFLGADFTSGISSLSASELFVTLLFNNLLAALSAILSGFVPLLRLPAFTLGLNAVLYGALASLYESEGPGTAAFLAGTLPHGVTELSALCVACGCGFYLCETVTDHVMGKEGAPPVSKTLIECMRAFATLVFPLLLISALIEAFVTPSIMGLFT